MSATQLPSLWNHQTESVTATRRAFAHYCRPLFVSPTSWQWFQRLHCAGTYRVPLQEFRSCAAMSLAGCISSSWCRMIEVTTLMKTGGPLTKRISLSSRWHTSQ